MQHEHSYVWDTLSLLGIKLPGAVLEYSPSPGLRLDEEAPSLDRILKVIADCHRFKFETLKMVVWEQEDRADPDQNDLWSRTFPPQVGIVILLC